MAFLSGDEKDTLIINAIAAYVFFNEEEFYAEMAKYITLLDDGFTVDFKALAAFLKRFELGCDIRAKSLAAERCFKTMMASDGNYNVDFIVRQSTWNYFIKQVGMNFTKNESYNLSDEQGKDLASQGTVVFRTKKPAVKTEASAFTKKEEPMVTTKKPPLAEMKSPITEEKPVVTMKKSDEPVQKPQIISTHDQETQNKLIALREENLQQKQQLKTSEGKIAALTGEVSRMKELLRNRFLTGLAIGIIGTVLAVLMIGQISGCTAQETAPESTAPTASVTAVSD